jgi:hypothetical protein
MAKKKEQKPYLFKTIKVKKRYYNPDYGDDRLCQCDHPYHRHFDSYENMIPVGCKYCDCFVFMQAKPGDKKHEKSM